MIMVIAVRADMMYYVPIDTCRWSCGCNLYELVVSVCPRPRLRTTAALLAADQNVIGPTRAVYVSVVMLSRLHVCT